MSEPFPTELTRGMLKEELFLGEDAAVVFVADGQELNKDGAQIIERCYPRRLYLAEGGYYAKIFWAFARGHEELFQREQKGWDHQNCDFCDERISIGEVFWTAPSRYMGIWLFCRSCYDKLPE